MKVTATVVILLACTTSLPTYAARCIGAFPCAVCTSCSSCAHCAKQGGICGTCAPGNHSHQQSRYPTPRYQTRRSQQPRIYLASRATRQSRRAIKRRAAKKRAVRPRTVKPRVVTTVKYLDFSGRCVGVYDGDTITVLTVGPAGQRPVKVQLYGVDAPEKQQAFGEKAKQYTSSLVLGKQVKVFNKGKDIFGRYQGWVFVGNTGVNGQIIRYGYGWYDKQSAPRETKLAQLQEQARAVKRGLWRDPRPVAPWEWKNTHSQILKKASVV